MPPLRILPRVFAAALCTVIGAVAGLLGIGGGELRLPVLVSFLASLLYLAGGLMFRYAWVGAGPPSARDDRVVAEMARSRRHGA